MAVAVRLCWPLPKPVSRSGGEVNNAMISSHLRRTRPPVCVVVALICGISCARGWAAEQSDEAALKKLHAEIVELIGDAPCANLVHCRVLALGGRPCGGADEYLAYSSLTGNKDILDGKAFEYGFLQDEVRRASRRAGTCEVLSQPRAMCLDRRCRLDTAPH